MNREEVKKILPILTAFVEDKNIQVFTNPGIWVDSDDISLYNLSSWPEGFRIKPEPTYRPFKDAKECMAEMLKHHPFGFITSQCAFFHVIYIEDKLIGYGSACGAILHTKFNDALEIFTFADGTPFGIKK